jgi:hypothetical protein
VRNDHLKIDTSGASNIQASGETKKLEIDMSGASNINTRELRALSVRVSGSGAGHAKVYASEELNAKLSGVGSITYAGDPKVVTKDVSGLGSISKE